MLENYTFYWKLVDFFFSICKLYNILYLTCKIEVQCMLRLVGKMMVENEQTLNLTSWKSDQNITVLKL